MTDYLNKAQVILSRTICTLVSDFNLLVKTQFKGALSCEAIPDPLNQSPASFEFTLYLKSAVLLSPVLQPFIYINISLLTKQVMIALRRYTNVHFLF